MVHAMAKITGGNAFKTHWILTQRTLECLRPKLIEVDEKYRPMIIASDLIKKLRRCQLLNLYILLRRKM